MTSILIVEDNVMNMELFTFVLKSNGVEVSQAFDGNEALEKIKSACFDLILLDIQLPRIDGLEVLKKIKLDPGSGETPVIALTAYAMNRDEKKFIGAGFKGYISKPIDILQFPDRMNSFLKPEGLPNEDTQ